MNQTVEFLGDPKVQALLHNLREAASRLGVQVDIDSWNSNHLVQVVQLGDAPSDEDWQKLFERFQNSRQ